MTRLISRILLALFFVFAIGPPVFAQKPKVLKLSEVRFDTKAIGFSVFGGKETVEPEKFDLQLRRVIDTGGFPIILSRIFGGPMETPLEKIGAVAGMSGSPIFIGDCGELDECVAKASSATSNVFLVGALAYGPGYLIEDGPNAGLTSAEYMLGSRLGGYEAANQFSIRPPDRFIVNGHEFQNLLLFSNPTTDGLLPLQGGGPSTQCDGTVKSRIRPGSMISVFLAKGTINIPASGTVTWVDGNKIYAFGHPFFGSGVVSYPFSQTTVADTVQTPLNPYKVVGCRLDTQGAILADGMFEIAGVIGHEAQTLPYRVELHLGQELAVLEEQISVSPMAPTLINQLPIVWGRRILGDTTYLPVAYQTRIRIADQREVFLKKLVMAHLTADPFASVFNQLSAVLNELGKSGFNYNLKEIAVHVDPVRGMNVWAEKESFLSQATAAPGETVHLNVVLEEQTSKALSQISIPIEIPTDFADRFKPGTADSVTIVVQSADKFVSETPLPEIGSLSDVVKAINNRYARNDGVLYVQKVIPHRRDFLEKEKDKAKSSVKDGWNWTEIGQGDVMRFPDVNGKEVFLSVTPSLDHYVSFAKKFSIKVELKPANSSAPSRDKSRKWYFLFLF